LSKKAYKELLKSFKETGYVETIVLNLDDTIIAGHQRYKVMIDLGWKNKFVDCRIPSRLLSQQECDKYLLRSNKVTGEWDQDILLDKFNEETLIDCGFTREELGLDDDDNETIEGVDSEQKLAIEITCDNEQQQRELYEELQERGLECRLLTLRKLT
jgi:hypothetical protein